MTGTRAIAPDLWRDTPEGPVLLGARSQTTGVTVFPASLVAPGCEADDMEEVELPRRGVLWTHTVQGFAPKAYAGPGGDDFRPYGVGYVDLGEVIVEARLTEADPARLRIGSPVELVVEELSPGLSTYAFAPVDEEGTP